MVPTQTLTRFIYQEGRKYPEATGELSDLLTAIALGIKYISQIVASAGFKGLDTLSGHTNVQGEKTFKLDEIADKVLVEILSSSRHFGSLVSEERDDILVTNKGEKSAKYVVAFDPLDGSSNIGTNIPVGTIFTIFKKKDDNREAKLEDYFQPATSLVAAGYSVYGAKTTLVYSAGRGVHGFTLDPAVGEFLLTEENIKIPESGSIYSVNEGYWEIFSEKTRRFITMLKTSDNPHNKPYTGRYVGSLVADFDRTLRKGGVFMHPATQKRPNGKLRLLYECMPLSFILEQAGGIAIDGEKPITQIMPSDIHQRIPFIVGSPTEVKWYMDMG